MQQLFTGLGQLVNGIRGQDGPVSGGGGGGGGGDVGLKDILAAREREATAAQSAADREAQIQDLMRQNNWDRTRATSVVASGEAGKYNDPKTVAQRDLDTRLATNRQELVKKTDQFAKELNLDPTIVRDLIERGELTAQMTPKERAAVAETRSQTRSRDQATDITGADYGNRNNARTNPGPVAAELSKRLGREVSPQEVSFAAQSEDGWKALITQSTQGGQSEIGAREATAAETRRTTAEKVAMDRDWKADRADPANFMDRFGIDSRKEADRILTTAESRADYIKGRTGATTTTQQNYASDLADAQAKGPEAVAAFHKRFPTRADYDLAKSPKTLRTPGEEAQAGILGKVGGKHVDLAEEVETSNIHREGAGAELFKAWDDSIRSGGVFAERENRIKKTLSRAFGREDMAGAKTDQFFALLNQQAASLADTLPGVLSDKDVEFIKQQVGSKEMSPQTLRKLMIINDNIQMAKDELKRERIIRAKRAAADDPDVDPETAKALKVIPTPGAPPVNEFVKRAAANPTVVAAVVANRDNPQELATFDHETGRNASRYILERYDREQAAKGGR
jgi:hypothetical protein